MEDTDLEMRKKFIAAMIEVKKVIKQPAHDCKVDYSGTRYPYSSLGEILRCLSPLLEYGLYFDQGEISIKGKWFMWTEIFHVDGFSTAHRTFIKPPINVDEQIEVYKLQHPDPSKYKKALVLHSERDFASSITYARRYALCSIFGLYGQADIDVLPEIMFEKEEVNHKPPKKEIAPPPKYISDSLKSALKKECEKNPEFRERLKNNLVNLMIPSIDSIVIEREGFYRESLEKFKIQDLPPPVAHDDEISEGVLD